MTYIAKPRLHHPTLEKNKVGYTRRDLDLRTGDCLRCQGPVDLTVADQRKQLLVNDGLFVVDVHAIIGD